MRKVDDYERVRKAYYIENLSIREISRRYRASRRFVRKAIHQPEPERYQLTRPRPARVLGPFRGRVHELLEESKGLPKKQRYTSKKICEMIVEEGYQGSAGTVHNYISQQKKKEKAGDAFIPLEFDLGKDSQVDWGEAIVIMKGQRMKVQFFAMRLNYSRVRFVMAFPFQKQEAFFEGHIHGFHFFGGVPYRITYDNLKTAVYRILEGRKRQEQQSFQTFRSYYLFDSNYCNPAQGHEKGGVENDVGYIQRNFFSPLPEVDSFEELNQLLLERCEKDVYRHIRGKTQDVAELWKAEKSCLLPMPSKDYLACVSRPAKVNPYSQVVYETNRYSVPAEYAGKQVMLRAFPFRVEVLYLDRIVAAHPRCFAREKDILDPLHYLSLLEKRPGAFHHAKPLRQWRKEWPPAYDQLLKTLQQNHVNGSAVREFIAVLKLHKIYPVNMVRQAIQTAVASGMAHLDGVQYQLRQQVAEKPEQTSLDLSAYPELSRIGHQPIDLQAYNQLLETKS